MTRAEARAEGRRLTRRDLLSRGAAIGAIAIAGPGFVAAPDAAWAVETKALKPETMATLIQMARDIYPHDRVADRFYAAAVKMHDDAAATSDDVRAMIENGVAALDQMAQAQGAAGYAALGWEEERVALLRQIEAGPFFQSIRGNLVVGLYNNPEVWPVFGYEGESFSKGGYLDNGFDDIAWL